MENMSSFLHLTYPFAATNNAKGSVAQLANQLSLFVSYLDITFLNATISRQNCLSYKRLIKNIFVFLKLKA